MLANFILCLKYENGTRLVRYIEGVLFVMHVYLLFNKVQLTCSTSERDYFKQYYVHIQVHVHVFHTSLNMALGYSMFVISFVRLSCNWLTLHVNVYNYC